MAELQEALGPLGVRPSNPCGDCGGRIWRQARSDEADEMERALGVPDEALAAVFWACVICGNMCMIRFDASPGLLQSR